MCICAAMCIYVCVVDEVSKMMDDISTALAHCIPQLRFINSQLPDDLRLETFQLRQLPVEESVEVGSAPPQLDTHRLPGQLSYQEEELETAYEDMETAYEDMEENESVEAEEDEEENRTLLVHADGEANRGEVEVSGGTISADAAVESQEGTRAMLAQEDADQLHVDESDQSHIGEADQSHIEEVVT